MAESPDSAAKSDQTATVPARDPRQADLPFDQHLPSEHEVPASLATLLATHESRADLDSRRYLRRSPWPFIAHALAVGCLPAAVGMVVAAGVHYLALGPFPGAVASAVPSPAVGLGLGLLAGAAIAISQQRVPGPRPLGELVTAASLALVMAWAAIMVPAALPLVTGMTPAASACAWRWAALGLADMLALVALFGLLIRSGPAQLVRQAAGLSAVLAMTANVG
jgi:hypothetical protein